jgi:hypothetical protein
MSGSTFLALTNRVLTHFNEVNLTSSNFASASGFYSVAKDAVQDAIRTIQQTEREWPFNWHESTMSLSATSSGTESQLYPFPTTTTDFCETIDWESFSVVRNDTLEVPETHLGYLDYDDYLQNFRDADKAILDSDTSIRIPEYVFRPQYTEYWGISSKPDRNYSIRFEWWGYEVDLATYTDTTSVPSRFNHVIHDGALARCYTFRGDTARAALYEAKFTKGVSVMRDLLINRYKVLRDKRVNKYR